MPTLAEVFVAVRPDSSEFGRDLSRDLSRVDAAPSGRRAGEGFTSGFGSSVKKVAGLAAAALAAAGTKQFIDASIDQASDLSEAANVTSLVFRDQAKSLDGFFKTSASSIGLSEAAARQAAAGIGGLLNNLGYTREESAGLSKDVLTLGADLGSAFNKDPAQAVEAIGSALRGETEPIRAFNVTLNDAAVKAKALELGLYSGKGAIDDNAKAQATLALITQQTSDVQGDFANTADGYANAQRRAAAGTENLKGKIGNLLLPTVTALAGVYNDKVLPALDRFVTDAAPKVETWTANMAGSLQSLYDVIASGDFTGPIFGMQEDSRLVDWLFTIRETLQGFDFDSVADHVRSFFAAGDGSRLPDILTSVADSGTRLLPFVQQLLTDMPGVVDVLDVGAAALEFLADHVDTLTYLIPVMIGALLLWKAAQIGANIAMAASPAIRLLEVAATRQQTAAIRGLTAAQGGGTVAQLTSTGATNASLFTRLRATAATVAATVAERAKMAATKAATAAQWLFNTALRNNPIGIVVTALAALVGGLVLAYRTSDTFRQVVDAAWAKIKDAVAAAWTGTIQPALTALAGYVTGTLIPTVKALWTGTVKPAFEGIGSVIRTVWHSVIKPVLQLWWAYVTQVLVPMIRFLWNDVVSPVFGWIGRKVKDTWDGVIRPALAALWGYVTNTLVPTLRALWQDVIRPTFEQIGSRIRSTWQDIVKPALEDFKTRVDNVRDGFSTAKDKFDDFMDKLRSFTLPGWVKDLADLVSDIKDGVSGVASNVWSSFTSAFGDAPGSMKGVRIGPGGSYGGGRSEQGYAGTALRRVQAALPSGLSVTSTYRSPAHNRRVGGSPTSLHMDKNNPAVDIAGPVPVMDRFAADLAAMGGWRQLLYRVAGHYDHIHVAHSGGIVSSSWPRSPGDGPDERTARLQVGEVVVPKSAAAPSSSMPSRVILQVGEREFVAMVRQEAAAGARHNSRMYQGS